MVWLNLLIELEEHQEQVRKNSVIVSLDKLIIIHWTRLKVWKELTDDIYD